MRKILLSIIFLFILSLPLTGIAAKQAEERPMTPTLGIVIIGEPEFKSNEYIDKIKKKFRDIKYPIVIGSDIQSKYQKYWFEKGFLEEQQLTKANLDEFARFSGHDKVLYLVIDPSEIEKDVVKTFASHVVRTKVTLKMTAFLSSSEEVLHLISTSKQNDSVASTLRAKRDAFDDCLREIATEMKPYLN